MAVLGRTPRTRRGPRLDPYVKRVGLVTVLGSVMSVLDTTIVNVALDSLATKLHTTISTIQWVVTGYLLALAATVPVSAWAARRIGIKKLYLISVLVFTIGSALCGLAWSAGSLIFFRILQGIGGGMIMPVGQMILVRAAGKENLGRVMGVLSTPTVLAPVLGPTLGGILLQSFGWQWIFLINVPIGVVALIYGIKVLPVDEHEEAGKLDVAGLVLAAAGTVSLIYGLSDAARLGNLSRVGSGGAIAMGLALLTGFVWWSLRSPYPVLDLKLFRHRGYAAVTMASLATGAAMFASMVIAPLYFQVVRGEDATRTGLLLAPTSLGVAAVISAAGRATDRFGGGRVAVTGLLVGCASLLPYTAFTEHTSYLLIVGVATIRGIGFGAIGLPLFAVAFSMLEEDQIRDGSAQLNIIQRIGGSIGTAVATVILQQALTHHAHTPGGEAAAFRHTYWWLFFVGSFALIPAVWLLLVERRSREHDPDSRAATSAALESALEVL
ncbi:MAG TPA: MDR family MFS transporter [Frankiaceae bacterium]|jgi:EmrB/QacA subfamily drug resistance transporter|nr:MDR family MFS transporter [Frankiaceae bacterium]